MAKEIEVIKKDVGTIAKKISDLEIKTADDLMKATDVLSQIKTAQKNLKATKDTILQPQLDAVTATRNLFKPFEEQLSEAEGAIKDKMIRYEADVDAAAKKQEATIEKKLDEGTMKPETAARKIEQIPTVGSQVTGARGVVQFRIQKKIVIENATLLPREYLIPDESKIRKAALAGLQIPGVKVVEEKIVAAR